MEQIPNIPQPHIILSTKVKQSAIKKPLNFMTMKITTEPENMNIYIIPFRSEINQEEVPNYVI